MKLGKGGYRYVGRFVPKTIPKGLRLVHNFEPGDPTRPLGADGFRAWWEGADAKESTIHGETIKLLRCVCRCGWAPHLKRHYNADAWRQKGNPARQARQ